MSKLPADNTFVDSNSRIVQAWLSFLRALEPASGLSATQISALKALIAASEEEAAAPAVEGDIPYQGPSEPTVVHIGNPGDDFTINDAGTAPEWVARRGTFDYIGTIDGAFDLALTHTISGIEKPYRRLELFFQDVSFVVAASLEIELSGDGGVNWSTATAVSSVQAAGERTNGTVIIDNAAVLSGTRLVRWRTVMAAAGADVPVEQNIYTETSINGYINAIRVDAGSNGFAAGTFTLIGWY